MLHKVFASKLSIYCHKNNTIMHMLEYSFLHCTFCCSTTIFYLYYQILWLAACMDIILCQKLVYCCATMYIHVAHRKSQQNDGQSKHILRGHTHACPVNMAMQISYWFRTVEQQATHAKSTLQWPTQAHILFSQCYQQNNWVII